MNPYQPPRTTSRLHARLRCRGGVPSTVWVTAIACVTSIAVAIWTLLLMPGALIGLIAVASVIWIVNTTSAQG